MQAKDVLEALQLPGGALVNQRVPKKLLIENGAPTAADKQQINEGIEEIHWVAALKPSNCGVPEFRDEQREYLEIAVLHLSLRSDARQPRLVELLHRAVPYPMLLVTSQQADLQLSLAHQRWSQNEAGKVVLDGELVHAEIGDGGSMVMEFLSAMAITQQPRGNLYRLYQGWIDTLRALHAAQRTGSFRLAEDAAAAAARHYALQACSELEAMITGLRTRAAKERQIARQVELNLQIQQLQKRLSAAQEKLNQEHS